MKKSAEEIKEQMVFWFLKYYKKELDQFEGTEPFTFFDLLTEEKRAELEGQLSLRNGELPVFILTISEDQVIVNTTERFIRLSQTELGSIEYTDFEWHDGYESIIAAKKPNGKPISVKTIGYRSKFGLRKTNGEVIFWDIPTGSPGFAFWNVTKRCELIGRKILVEGNGLHP